MHEHVENSSLISREKAIHLYIQALDQGDMEVIAQILDAACDDPELEGIITSINLAYQQEEQLTPIALDAQFIRDLHRKYLTSILESISKIRVVVIEDHDLTRVGIRTALLQKQEIEVVGEAANATEGLKLLKNLQPDIAIIDIGLPDKDGIELTREVKSVANGQESATKVLILTLRDRKEEVLAAFAAGADSYCMKDIKFDNLLEAIRVTYNGNAWIDPAIARIVLQQAQQNPPKQEIVSMVTDNFAAQNSDRAENEEMIDPYTLTERELEVLQLIVEGCSNAVIAKKLYITVGTVKTHVRNILNKLCADDRTQAAVRALRSGLAS